MDQQTSDHGARRLKVTIFRAFVWAVLLGCFSATTVTMAERIDSSDIPKEQFASTDEAAAELVMVNSPEEPGVPESSPLAPLADPSADGEESLTPGLTLAPLSEPPTPGPNSNRLPPRASALPPPFGCPVNQPCPGESPSEYTRRLYGPIPQPVSLRERTQGQLVQIAGRQVQFPDDAYVEGVVMFVSCAPGGACAQPPYLIVQRGDSLALVYESTGMIEEHISPGQESPFDFLKEALQ